MRTVTILLVAFCAGSAFAIDISRRYRSPRNPERKVRSSTELIVLHTTEAPARSSLNKLSDRGEAHYCVTEEGSIYHIVDTDREAFHAGRSMWNGKEDVDKFSIGIECVGYHDKPMPSVQLTAIRDLVEYLQRIYRVPDERVVCHSHVAYGSPNKWQRRRHRGRKRCGMLFAMPSVRRVLGLKARPAFDADTRAGRLTVGDDYLRQVLYGGVDTMVGKVGGRVTPAPASSAWAGSTFVKDPKAKPNSSPTKAIVAKEPGPKPIVLPKPVDVAKPVATPKSIAAPKPVSAVASIAASAEDAPPRSIAQLMLKGYEEKGTVTKTTSALRIAGAKWNASDTYYTIRGKVIPGCDIDSAHIENGMCIWMKK